MNLYLRRPKLMPVMQAWLPLAVAVTGLAGLVHLAVQQALRQSANEPQITYAEGIAMEIGAGAPVKGVIPTFKTPVDIATSLTPFMAAYDDTGKALTSSGQLDGAPPQLPSGVFAYVRAHGQDRITWQPKPGVRQAIVVTRYGNDGAQGGFIVVGRSLREVERNEGRLMLQVLSVWAVTMLATLLTSYSLAALEKNSS